jgi:hypothetical protein
MRHPETATLVGGPNVGDFMIVGFLTRDSFVSRLEQRRELASDQQLWRLLRWARAAWVTQLFTVFVGLFLFWL